MKARTWVAALSGASLALAATVVGVGASTNASATPSNTPPGPPQATAAGMVVLAKSTTSTSSAISYYPNATGLTSLGTPSGTPQQISTSGKCTLSPTTGSMVAFTSSSTSSPTKNVPGYVNGSIGVVSGNPNTTATACSQVNQVEGESVIMSLNTSTSGPFATQLGQARVKAATIDVNLSGNVIIQASLYRGGTPDQGGQLIGGAELQSGFSTPAPLARATDNFQTCNYNTSNSGPQNGYANECYWTIPPVQWNSNLQTPSSTVTNISDSGAVANLGTDPGVYDWDTIVLTPIAVLVNGSPTPTKGAFSIQGGQSWTGAPAGTGGPTTFTLEAVSDGTLNCGDMTSPVSASSTGNVTNVAIARLTSNADGSSCVPVNYTLSNDGGAATFHKDLSAGQGAAEFSIYLQRTFPATTSQPGVTSPASLITPVKGNWELPGYNTDYVLPFCSGPAFSGTVSGQTYGGTFSNFDPSVPAGTSPFNYLANGPTFNVNNTALLDPANGYDQVPDTTLGNVQYACIYGESTEISAGTNQVIVYDFVFLSGDFKAIG